MIKHKGKKGVVETATNECKNLKQLLDDNYKVAARMKRNDKYAFNKLMVEQELLKWENS